jgi:hypothetical protein
MRLLAALLAALATTSAPAKPVAQLFVTALDTRPGTAAETDVNLSLRSSTRSAEIVVPPGYTIDLGARLGTVIGMARTNAASTLVAAAPGLWRATGLTVAVSRSDDGGYRLSYELAAATRDVDLDIQHGLTNPRGGIVTWRAFVGNGVEARSVVAFPQALEVRAAVSRGTLRVSGRLLFAGKPRVGVNVHLAVATREDFQDARELGAVRTDAEGRYRLTAKVTARRQMLLIAYVNFYTTPCAGCLSESIAPPPSELVAIPKR